MVRIGLLGISTALVLSLLICPGSSKAIPISPDDLWDVTQGVVVDFNTPPIPGSDSRDMFGGAFGSIEATNLLFSDFVQVGFTHRVEWHTPSPITLRSFILHAQNEGNLRRSFSRFTLFAGEGAGGPWVPIYDTGTGFMWANNFLDLAIDLTPVNAQFFKAEFVQAPFTDSRAVGPRIQELDGFATFLDGSVPEPASSLLMALGLGALAFRRGIRLAR